MKTRKRFVKKAVSLLLSIVMLLTMLPAAYAANEPEELTWCAQSMGTSGDLTLPEGAVVPTPGGKGFVADYKAFFDAGIASPVIYSPDAPAYENSILECDVTVSAEYQSFFRVAFFTRFADGANLGGIGYESASNVMYSYVQNGSEKWPGISNLNGANLLAGQTYHIKLTTLDGTITLYVDGQKVAEQVGIEALPQEGRYGFRIWGGENAASAGKTVTVDNISFTGVVKSSVDSERIQIEEADWDNPTSASQLRSQKAIPLL